MTDATLDLKDWLGYELDRNKKHGKLYVDLLTRALRVLAPENRVDVLIGHHITFELNGDLTTENEIPSADCLMFDHELMHAVFGDAAKQIMVELVLVPCEERDALLTKFLEKQT